MPCPSTYLVAATFAVLACADTIKITAQSDNTFSPSSATAKQGDILEFHFQSKNHSVVAGDYKYPCSPVPIGSGFFSGFLDAESGEASKVFRVTVSNGDPLVFYSSQEAECPKGMVGIVNANDKQTLDDYKKRAGELARGVTPGTSSYGGELADNKSSGSKSNDGGKKDEKNDKSAANTLRAPFATIVAILGAVMICV
ncbi:hypothetical protein QQS21_011776 [Conoideocrella luteorostrata]|uniref:Extracellular serine-rich protein n=1 Tax=Conoideocrella luteorostrata TaxID=1105319 RepID=A0AAJ0CCG2_9HYPO|nr:hypothetical protein QQS21_011776 [Conoideocrella luteorostrata]